MDRRIDPESEERAEKHVADEIEKVIIHPGSIEEEELLDAADLEELEYRDDEE